MVRSLYSNVGWLMPRLKRCCQYTDAVVNVVKAVELRIDSFSMKWLVTCMCDGRFLSNSCKWSQISINAYGTFMWMMYTDDEHASQLAGA